MDVPEVNIEEARKRLEEGEALFVDIRDPGSYGAGHIEGALHLTNESVQEFLTDTARDREVIVYCYHGNSSRGAASFLLAQGFEDVRSMKGGYEAWRQLYGEPTG